MLHKLQDIVEGFPPGRVPLLLLTLAVLSAGAIIYREAATTDRALTVWTFTHIASEEFKDTLEGHPRWQLVGRGASRMAGDEGDTAPPYTATATRPGPERVPVRLSNLGGAMFDRLALAIMTRTELPNLVEVEQAFVGRYLRGPAAHIPFVDLTERLKSEDWYGKVVPARFARYSVEGRIFGIPHDVHPMVLVYRPDVLADLGYTPADLATWEGFKQAARDFYRPGATGTSAWRRGIALHTTEGWDFLMLLWQRGGDVFDAQGDVIIDDPLAIDTLEFYVSLFNEETPVAGGKLSDLIEDCRALANGQFLAYAAPDWMLAAMQLNAETILKGKVKCIPLPAWETGGRRTSTAGGTAMFIPADAKRTDESWTLAKDLYFNEDALIKRFRKQNIIPALTTVYDHSVFDEPLPFFQGQAVGRLLTELAPEVPPINGSPYTPEASKYLDIVIPQVLKGSRTPAEALDDVARKLRAVMARDRAAIQAAQGVE